MLNFRNFTRLENILKFSTSKQSIVSEQALKRIMCSSKSCCLIIPQTTKDISYLVNLIKENYRCYPVIVAIDDSVKSCILLTQPSTESDTDFKNKLNSLFESLSGKMTLVYKNNNTVKILTEDAMTESNNCPLVEDVEYTISTQCGSAVYLLGIEVPTSEQLIEEYRKNSYIVFSLSEEEIKTARKWENII